MSDCCEHHQLQFVKDGVKKKQEEKADPSWWSQIIQKLFGKQPPHAPKN
jgi:hypothetical protein